MFCGSNPGARPAYMAAATRLGEALAARDLGLVYGGASVGLMGAVADAAAARGGRTCGILPDFMTKREIAHRGLTELVLVGSMHERKAEMGARSDAFVALPGGFGTLDEIFEVLTWSQLGLHKKPVALLDVDGYWTSLVAFLDHAAREGLLRPEHRAMLFVESDVDRLLDRLVSVATPEVPAVLGPAQT
ncbi:Lysine decarboxylase family protein [Minicystis rosea]|nr:Lysine decarboxylase family protein [Minicystis rosea]